MLEDVLYFIYNLDANPFLRLVVPEQIQSTLLTHYHYKLGHLIIDKTNDAIHAKYFEVNLFKDVLGMLIAV